MADIIVNERVINKIGEAGVIVSVDDYIHVSYKNKKARLPLDAFEQKLLRYENKALQSRLDQAEEKKLEAERAVFNKDKKMREEMESQAPIGVKFNSVSLRLEPAPASLASVKRKHKSTIQAIFDQCDKDVESYYAAFHPTMKYIKPRVTIPRYFCQEYAMARPDLPPRTEYYRSKYCVGFVTKYENAYVLRVLSRNDVYTIGMMGGFTVTDCDVTEILRIVCIDGETYYFSKNLSAAGGSYKNTNLYKKWQATSFGNLVTLNEVVRSCDCKYLNDFIAQKDVNCSSYAKLLMAALFSNKAEIVFKHKLFRATKRIDDVADYLEEFTPKQIDFASKHNAINALPVIKRFANLEQPTLMYLEQLMEKRNDGTSVYGVLKEHLARLEFNLDNLDKKLITFLQKAWVFDAAIYRDYINELALRDDSTPDDFFDRDYLDRHEIMLEEKTVNYSAKTKAQYEQIAAELSWIDREEDGFFITIPKTISDFKAEGSAQHHCVYTNRYFLDVIARHSIIVFLREEENTPFVTIEYDYETFELRQARRKFNGAIDTKLYQFIVDLGKQLKFEMDSREYS